ncbi:DUF4197 domain-containing protein [Rhodoferax ferrireducens]|nr:DUF4197 domain-containing protein [Rhodoferax ferrireducens]WPC65314.1 DUF4197 domain-containing protein [Rhodoferax ferrireducens]
MKKIMKFMAALIVGLATTWVQAEGLAGISSSDASASVKEALTTGAKYAVSSLGKENGFLGNSKVKIPLPEPLNRVEGLMRTFGMARQADELIETMNHAAEAAVAQAGPILMDSIKKMSVKDAKDILTGGDDSVSQYFRRTSSDALTQKFRPIVKRATQKVQLGEKYNNIAGKAASAGLIDQKNADLDSYVTQKSLDGLFAMIAEQEKSLRSNPLGASSSLLKKVFGAL